MSEFFALAPGAKEFYTFDWSEEIPAGSPAITISSVSYSISPSLSPQQLREFDTAEQFDQYRSSVGLQGALHGRTYLVTALCTLSNGEVIPKAIAIKGFAS